MSVPALATFIRDVEPEQDSGDATGRVGAGYYDAFARYVHAKVQHDCLEVDGISDYSPYQLGLGIGYCKVGYIVDVLPGGDVRVVIVELLNCPHWVNTREVR